MSELFQVLADAYRIAMVLLIVVAPVILGPNVHAFIHREADVS